MKKSPKCKKDFKIAALHRILREEKARLGITLRHKVKPYRWALPVEGAVFLATDDVFQLTVERGTIELLCHQDKLPALTDNDGRLMIRHELCHVLDRLDEKIGHAFFGFKPSGPHLIESELLDGVIAETARSYHKFVMARRYVKLFGLDEFETMNEIGMDEFLTLTHSLLQQFQRPTATLQAYVLYGPVFGTLKEVVKVYFYRPRDVRFPGGIWDLVEWLCQDFGYLDTLAINWKQKSEILTFIALAIFESFELPSAFELPLRGIQRTSRARRIRSSARLPLSPKRFTTGGCEDLTRLRSNTKPSPAGIRTPALPTPGSPSYPFSLIYTRSMFDRWVLSEHEPIWSERSLKVVEAKERRITLALWDQCCNCSFYEVIDSHRDTGALPYVLVADIG